MLMKLLDESVSFCNVNFDENPIRCDKAVEKVMSSRRDEPSTIEWNCNIKIAGLGRTVCDSPPYLRGWKLTDLSMFQTTEDKYS